MPTQKIVNVTLPYPPSDLFPNRKLGWQKKMLATRQARNDAYLAGLVQGDRKDLPMNSVFMVIVWYYPSRHIPDWDSIYRATKPIVDGGLVDAGYLVEDSPKVIKGVLLLKGGIDKDNPRTEFYLTEGGW